MPIIYRLDLIQNASLAAFYFEERKNWNLMKWAEESFGVYYGDALLDVRLRFSKEVAQRAANHFPSIAKKKPKRAELDHLSSTCICECTKCYFTNSVILIGLRNVKIEHLTA